jgi:hypothetical protein
MAGRWVKPLALAAALAAAGPGQTLFTLSQSVSSVPAATGSAACGPTPLTYTVDNGYFRSYSLAGIPGNVEIVSVSFGVQSVIANQPGGYPMAIRIFADPTPATIAPYSGLVFRHLETFTLPSTGSPTVITRALTGIPPVFTPTETVVVEVFAADGAYTTSTFLIGQNSLGQSAPSYIRGPACSVIGPDVSNLANIGFASMHLIIDITCTMAAPPQYPGTNEDLALFSGLNANPPTTGTASELKFVTAGDGLTVEVLSPNGTFNFREVALIAQPFTTGFPPFPPAAPNIHMQLSGMFFLIGGVASPLGAPLLSPGGTSMSFVIPAGLTGNSVLFQGAVVTWAPPFALNGLYASTNGHEIRIL